ncbi:MAG: 16S rRNA (guanine(966)-N(2))-methyltransferase RsmD [Lachnospiraceae bacterium]|nr:16S rRNA (guanine(966)-N(2))-methyltransferase RsmD [Lachnospiraceae bacterium]
MRVIAGSARSLPLKTAPGQDIRPTTDKTKETLFNILQPRLFGCSFLDLFAGSGAIGIEALSRGAAKCVFADLSRTAIRIIEENLAFTRLGGHAEILREDASSCIRRLSKRERFDVIFLDPPFGKGLEKEPLMAIAETQILSDGGIVVLEAPTDTDLDFLNGCELKPVRVKSYGRHAHFFFESGRSL